MRVIWLKAMLYATGSGVLRMRSASPIVSVRLLMQETIEVSRGLNSRRVLTQVSRGTRHGQVAVLDVDLCPDAHVVEDLQG